MRAINVSFRLLAAALLSVTVVCGQPAAAGNIVKRPADGETMAADGALAYMRVVIDGAMVRGEAHGVGQLSKADAPEAVHGLSTGAAVTSDVGQPGADRAQPSAEDAGRTSGMSAVTSAVAQSSLDGQQPYQPSEENLAAREDFRQSRFGIFIHWGIYSMLGRGEWVMQNDDLDYQEYPRLAGGFFPSKFDAVQWVRAIKASGARYITFTSRHHDGFSMFASKASGYNIVDATPFGRDVVGELAAACAEEGIRLHLYYSHLDWGRTDYYPLGRTGTGTGRPEGADGDWQRYLSFIDAQLIELLTNYGPIGAIWFDGVWDKDAYPREEQPAIWQLTHQYSLIHSLQPACLIGNNHHLLPFDGEDIQIFERDVPGANEYGLSGQEISQLPLETCQTMNRSWGYRITDTDYKSSAELIAYLAKTASKGANLLLNIGPRPDGSLPDEALERLEAIGKWLSVNGESIYGTEGGPVSDENGWGVSTRKGKVLYIHQLKPCAELKINLDGLRLKSAELLDGGKALKFRQKGSEISIPLPDFADGDTPRVIKLTFNKDL